MTKLKDKGPENCDIWALWMKMKTNHSFKHHICGSILQHDDQIIQKETRDQFFSPMIGDEDMSADSDDAGPQLEGGVVAASVGEPLPSPSWKEISCQVLPASAREMQSSTMQRVYHSAHLALTMNNGSSNTAISAGLQ